MLDEKLIWVIFLEFKMGGKAVVTTPNINNTFSPGTASEHTVQWWFKTCCKGDQNLEDEENSGWPSEVDNDQLRASSKLILLQLTWQIAKNLNVDHSMVIQHLKQTGKLKKLNKWVSHESTASQKNYCFEVLSSLTL